MAAISYRLIEFEREIVKYEDLKIFGPILISASYCFIKYGTYRFTVTSNSGPPKKLVLSWSHCSQSGKSSQGMSSNSSCRFISTNADTLEQRGLIVRANVPDALDEVVDWNPVFIDIEGAKFSTWRGVPSNPDKYVVIGDFFVTGIEKPTAKQTEGIRAIRRDLIDEVEPHHLVFKKHIPFAVLTLWTVIFTVGIHIPTGAFVSAPGETADSKLGVIRFNAEVQELAGKSAQIE